MLTPQHLRVRTRPWPLPIASWIAFPMLVLTLSPLLASPQEISRGTGTFGTLVPCTASPPSRPESTEIDNLAALTRLASVLRFFHPTDEIRGTNWDAVVLDALPEVRTAQTSIELAAALERFTRQLAPLVTIDTRPSAYDPNEALPADVLTARTLRSWRHRGVGSAILGAGNPTYRSAIETMSLGQAPTEQDLGIQQVGLTSQVSAWVPTWVPVGEGGHTVPRSSTTRNLAFAPRCAQDLAIVAVVQTWGILDTFHPYRDLIGETWTDDALRAALLEASMARTRDDVQRVLRRLLAKLDDGHAQVIDLVEPPQFQIPVGFKWVDGQVIVIGRTPELEGPAIGDELVSFEGEPAAIALARARDQVSAASEARRMLMALELLRTDVGEGDTIQMVFATPEHTTLEIAVATVPLGHPMVGGIPRPTSGTELAPGIVYFNLGFGAGIEALEAVLPEMRGSRALLLDLRGYPGSADMPLLRRLTKTPIGSPWFFVPVLEAPGAVNLERVASWTLEPHDDFLGDRPIVFLADEFAISRAETVLSIVRSNDLGEIVGSPTAGTNGDIDFANLPGDFRMIWTGLRVRWPNGSEFHPRGVAPDVDATPTRKSIIESRDAVLEEGLRLLQRRLREHRKDLGSG